MKPNTVSRAGKFKQRSNDPFSALHGSILQSDGGIAEAAEKVSRSLGVMSNKLSEAGDAILGLREALTLARWQWESRGCTAFAESVARDVGGVFVALPDAGEAADDDVLQAFLNASISLGDLARELVQARSDGVLDPVEFEQLQLAANRHVAAIQAGMLVLASQVRALPEPVQLVPTGRVSGRAA